MFCRQTPPPFDWATILNIREQINGATTCQPVNGALASISGLTSGTHTITVNVVSATGNDPTTPTTSTITTPTDTRQGDGYPPIDGSTRGHDADREAVEQDRGRRNQRTAEESYLPNLAGQDPSGNDENSSTSGRREDIPPPQHRSATRTVLAADTILVDIVGPGWQGAAEIAERQRLITFASTNAGGSCAGTVVSPAGAGEGAAGGMGARAGSTQDEMDCRDGTRGQSQRSGHASRPVSALSASSVILERGNTLGEKGSLELLRGRFGKPAGISALLALAIARFLSSFGDNSATPLLTMVAVLSLFDRATIARYAGNFLIDITRGMTENYPKDGRQDFNGKLWKKRLLRTQKSPGIKTTCAGVNGRDEGGGGGKGGEGDSCRPNHGALNGISYSEDERVGSGGGDVMRMAIVSNNLAGQSQTRAFEKLCLGLPRDR